MNYVNSEYPNPLIIFLFTWKSIRHIRIRHILLIVICQVYIPGIFHGFASDTHGHIPGIVYQVSWYHRFSKSLYGQPVPKAYRKCCVKFRTTPSVRAGFPAVIKHSLSEHLKWLKSKTWNDLSSANLFFLERRMRSAAKRVEQSLGYGYPSKMEWFSLRP